MIDASDRGFTLGDGLFETLLVEDGQVRHLVAHLDRLAEGCLVIGLPAPERSKVESAIARAPASSGPGRQALRLTWSAGLGGRGLDRPDRLAPVLSATCAPAPLPGAARLIIAAAVRRNEHSPASRLKTLSYLDNVLAREEARAGGASEAVMLNTAGHLACAAAANLFWIAEGQVFTPALDCGALPGITRARLISRHRVEAVVAGPEALLSAEAMFLTNSLTGVRAVERLDDRIFAPHPLVSALATRLQVA
jgi:branched-subunit amino acid aminotransferase/4-amino-4-deoxychorismate lyase